MKSYKDEEKQKLDQFLSDLALLGSLQGFRYFQPWLRGREEILLTVVNDDLGYPFLRSPGSLGSDASGHLPTYSNGQSTPRASALLPPASPCEREIAIPETHCTLFLLAAYAKYGRPYVWVRSNHQRFSGTELCDRDSPLTLPCYSEWDAKERSLSSGALVSFFQSLLLQEPRGTPLYTYVLEDLLDLTRLHAQTLQDLKEQNLIKNLL